MAIGYNIKRILSEKGITIKELSEKSGVSKNTLYSITKRDSKNVSPSVLTAISTTLGVSIFDLAMDVDKIKEDLNNIECFNEALTALGYKYKTIQIGKLTFDIEKAEEYENETKNEKDLPFCEISKEGQEPITLTVNQYEEFQKAVKYAIEYELNKFKEQGD